MLEFDHIAITVNNLDESIKFYENLGFKLKEVFNDDEYKWATLDLKGISLEIFESFKEDDAKISHMAFSFKDDKELIKLCEKLKLDETKNIFYGDLKRKSIFIEDNQGISIQLIKRK